VQLFIFGWEFKMKRILIFLIVFLFITAIPTLAGHRNYNYSILDGHTFAMDDIQVDLEDDGIVLYNEFTDDEIEITENYELIVNDNEIKLDAEQRELVKEYHTLVYGIVDEAVQIGLEGGKIGLAGAGMGLKALGGVFKLLLSSYDEDDLENEMEREEAKIEQRAEELEERANELEEKVEDMEDVFDEMFETIPELRELDWD
jgi:hypothetical protein